MEMGVVWVWVCVAVVAAVAAVVVDVGKATGGACWKMEHAGQVNTLRLAWQGSHPSMPLWLYGLP